LKKIDPKEILPAELHGYLLGAIAPRPIAFVSSVDSRGNVNLSPFSYFNIFGTNPPILVFSPVKRIRDNTHKHTLENVLEVKEVVINIGNYAMVEQMSLASTEYGKGVDEFVKAGLTPVSSDKVRPPRVGESPVAFECIVRDIVETGAGGGAANLVICEVVMVHVDEHILDSGGKIDPYKLDAVARMGGAYYCRVQGDAIFEIPKPTRNIVIGIDQIPPKIINSKILSGNNLARLAGVEALPGPEEIKQFQQDPQFQRFKQQHIGRGEEFETLIHEKAKEFIERGEIETAWLYLLQL